MGFNKKKSVIISVLLLGVLLLTGFLMWPNVRFPEEKPVLERGREYMVEEFVMSHNGEYETEGPYLDTRTVGEHEYVYTIRKGFLSRNQVLHYEVVDTTPPKIEIASRKVEIDPNETYTIEDKLENVSVDEGVMMLETDLNTSLSGTYTVKIEAVDEFGNRSSDSYEVIVKDLEAPIVFVTGDGCQIKKGDDFDIEKIISYGDNADPKPVLKVDGKVDTNKLGDYTLQATLTDASGNETSWDLTVSVVNKITYDDDEEEEEDYLFSDFLEDYIEEGRIAGIDVSEWQGDIDFKKLKDAGCEFIMMRIGFSYDGKLNLDKSFRDNLEGAVKAGMPAGIYYYSHDKNTDEVRWVVKQIFEELDGIPLQLPIVFDWENFSEFQEYEISFQGLEQLYETFEEEVLKHGYRPMLYGSKYYLENVWRNAENHPVWLAHYTRHSSYRWPYQLWQICAWGVVDGVDERVDFDVMITE